MRESEWLVCADPRQMMFHLIEASSELNQSALRKLFGFQNNTSKRKVRLFEVACCRRIAHLLIDERSINAVDAAERFADGKCNVNELNRYLHDATCAVREILSRREIQIAQDPWNEEPLRRYEAVSVAATAAARVAEQGVWSQDDPSYVEACNAAALADTRAYELAIADENREQCHLIRDIFGNPFHPVRIPDAVLEWRHGIIPQLAATLYENALFEFVPMVSKLLACAGCDCEAAICHGSPATFHVHGCWLIDQILGFD